MAAHRVPQRLALQPHQPRRLRPGSAHQGHAPQPASASPSACSARAAPCAGARPHSPHRSDLQCLPIGPPHQVRPEANHQPHPSRNHTGGNSSARRYNFRHTS
jgi:hypothetical protein